MSNKETPKLAKKGFKMPNTWIVVFIMVVFVAILSWIVPPGEYDYVQVEVNGTMRNLAVDGSFHYVDKATTSPTGVFGVFRALYTGTVESASTIFMIMICCSSFRIMVRTGAFHAGIGVIMKKLGNKAVALAVVLMIAFALCGSVFGMLSELYGFYPLIVGLGVALGYDAMFGFAILALGEYIGFTCGTLNPYNVAISQGISEVAMYSNQGYRWLSFVVLVGIAIVYLLRYGFKIRKDPTKSAVYGRPCIHSFGEGSLDEYKLTLKDILILLDLLVTLIILMVGLMMYGWGNTQLCGLFIMMAVVAALICRWSGDQFVDEFMEGVKGIAWGALIAGISRAILVVMNDAVITDTVIHALAELLKQAPSALSAQMILIAQTVINLPISSATGQAAVTMPIMAPLSDALGVSRDVACLAFQFGDGLSNLLWPTSQIVIVCGTSDIPYEKWVKWFLPLFFIELAAQMVLVGGAVMIGM
ncbi:MAG: YfcC family protein [Oscillibacter sp.]|nr:YfcC family protein [Oscillibacter sp.]